MLSHVLWISETTVPNQFFWRGWVICCEVVPESGVSGTRVTMRLTQRGSLSLASPWARCLGRVKCSALGTLGPLARTLPPLGDDSRSREKPGQCWGVRYV